METGLGREVPFVMSVSSAWPREGVRGGGGGGGGDIFARDVTVYKGAEGCETGTVGSLSCPVWR